MKQSDQDCFVSNSLKSTSSRFPCIFGLKNLSKEGRCTGFKVPVYEVYKLTEIELVKTLWKSVGQTIRWDYDLEKGGPVSTGSEGRWGGRAPFPGSSSYRCARPGGRLASAAQCPREFRPSRAVRHSACTPSPIFQFNFQRNKYKTYSFTSIRTEEREISQGYFFFIASCLSSINHFS